MGTRKVKLTGLGYWAKVFEDNRDLTGFEDALKDVGGQTSIDMDLDSTEMEKLKRSKSMKKGTTSPEDDSLTRVKFTRKWEQQYGGGEPKVVKADGTKWDFDEDGSIGNGSTIEVTLSVYDTSRKNIVGTRLDKVKVIEHVPYEPEDDEGEPEAPKIPEKSATKRGSTAARQPLEDDDIPFD